MQHGGGARVSTSLYETGLAWMTLPLAGYAGVGEMRKPYGSGIAEIAPYQAFQAWDGWLMIAAGNDNLFRKFCDVLGRKDLVTDPDYVTNSQRVINRERLIPDRCRGHYQSSAWTGRTRRAARCRPACRTRRCWASKASRVIHRPGRSMRP